MRDYIIRRLGGYADPLEALDAIKAGDRDKRDAFIEYLGGFPNWEAALAHVRTLGWRERNVVLTAAVKKLFNTIGPDDILREADAPKGQWLYRNRPLRPEQMQLLKAEAAAFSKSFFWETLNLELLYQANKRTYTQAEDIPDIVAGKLLVYYVDIVKTRLARILS